MAGFESVPIKITPQMDEAALAQWILRRLGAPVIKIELTQDHLDDAIEMSKRWFAAKKGVKRTTFFQYVGSEGYITLPSEVNVVTDVIHPAIAFDLTQTYFPFNLHDGLIPFDVFKNAQVGGLYSNLAQALEHIEMAKKILGSEPEWRQDDRRLYIWPIPKRPGAIGVEFISSIFNITELAERDGDLVKRMALARAKETLGDIWAKYPQLPTAQGSTSLNGSRMMERALGEIAQLDEEISLSGFPLGFLSG